MNKRLSVGIITMHRVTNFGSALQVYGLSQAIYNLGYNVKIIDYRFPNSYQKKHNEKNRLVGLFRQRNILKKISTRLNSRLLNIWKRQRTYFDDFYGNYFHLTSPYMEREDLISDPPQFDIVVTGSDQVWNTRHTYGDPTFLCDFARDTPHFSFGSSFSSVDFDYTYKNSFENLLKEYSSISVREQNSIKLVKELTGIDAELVCDPSLLLEKEHYKTLSSQSKVRVNKPYILAYILDYNFSPYPLIQELLDTISKGKGLDIIFLQCGSIHGNNDRGNKMIFDAGPLEFLWLIDNAEVVVTSSFHGAVFSILFEKKFYAVYDKESKDDRLKSLSLTLNFESRLLSCNQNIQSIKDDPIDWAKTNEKLFQFRNKSYSFLKNSLEKCLRNE